MSAVRAAMPPLEIRYPLCPSCGVEVGHDGDSFRCYTCKASWSDEGIGSRDGWWDEPDVPQCASIDGRFQPGGSREQAGRSHPILARVKNRCLLAAGHDGKHRADSLDEWTTDDDARRAARRFARGERVA